MHRMYSFPDYPTFFEIRYLAGCQIRQAGYPAVFKTAGYPAKYAAGPFLTEARNFFPLEKAIMLFFYILKTEQI